MSGYIHTPAALAFPQTLARIRIEESLGFGHSFRSLSAWIYAPRSTQTINTKRWLFAGNRKTTRRHPREEEEEEEAKAKAKAKEEIKKIMKLFNG